MVNKYFADLFWDYKNDKRGDTNSINSYLVTKDIGDFSLILPPESEFSITDISVEINRKISPAKKPKSDLKDLIYKSMKRRIFADCLLVSGGLDSSVLAKIFIELNEKASFVSCGFPDSEDMAAIDILDSY